MKVYFGVLLLVLSCSSQDYDLDDDYSDHMDSTEDSESVEVYNVTFKHKPERIVKLLSGNELSSVEDTVTERRPKTRVKLQAVNSKIKRKTTVTEQTTTVEASTQKPLKYSNDTNSDMSEEDPEPKNAIFKYPYVVSLQNKGSHYASGALVSKNWVLSSAGEFYNVRESIKLFRARLGSVDCKESGQVVPLKLIEIHPSYILGKPNYDVALISLAHEVALSESIRPIAITKVDDHVLRGKFISTYWPRILVKGQTLPSTAKEREKFNSMRVSTQHLIPWNRCYRSVQKQNEVLSESSLCLKPVLAHHSICSPDVGAPVVSDDGLWGITSGWTGKLCRLCPTVVTRVSAPTVRSWLTTIMDTR